MKKLFKIATLALALVCAAVFFTACTIPSSPKKARKNLEMEGYNFNSVIELTLKTVMGVLGVETEDVIFAVKVEEGEVDNVMLVYCTSKDTAKKMEDRIIEELRKEYTGEEIRSAFGLRSPVFTIKSDEDTLTFSVSGYGHGVGLSQYGARYLAMGGQAYDQILYHYYPGTQLRLEG